MIEKITLKHKIIRKGVCSCLPARIVCKRFEYFMLRNPTEPEKQEISITEDTIIDLINEATSFELIEDHEETVLYIDTDKYRIYVVIEVN